MELTQIERTVSETLGQRPERFVAAYAFGSFARGTAGPHSDVDVAVLYAEAPPRTLDGAGFDIEAALQKQLGRPVQLVTLNYAPVDLVHRVLRDGKLVINSDPSRRIAFEVQARNAFFDLEPHLRRYRRYGGRAS